MTFNLPDPGDAFDPPEGSPGTLHSAATSFSTASTSLTKDVTTARKAVTTATKNWKGPRTDDFKAGILGPQLELAETMAAVKEVGVVTGVLATALGKATREVDHEKGEWDKLVRESHEPGTVDPLRAGLKWAEGTRIIHAAREAKKTYKDAAGRVAGEIDAQTNRLVPGGSKLSPADIARKVAEQTGTEGIDARHPSTAEAWKVLKAGATHAKAIMSLTGEGDNTGELAGGPYSSLPTDVKALAAMREAMVAAGYSGKDLRAVTMQYWVAHAAQSAGIDLDQWDPSYDAKGNQDAIVKVYKFYGELYKKNPNLKWAGLANIVGPIFAAGFDDLGMIHELSDKLRDLPQPIKDGLPPDIRKLIESGADLTSAEVKYFEDKFLAMQKHIFMDLGSQHEAYATEGIKAINQMRSVGAINSSMKQAWDDVDSGVPSRVDRSAGAFADREQNHVIADQYDQMYEHDGPVGQMMTYMMTTVGATAVPGSHTPAEFSHVGIDVKVEAGWGPFSQEHHVKVDTPLPSFNIADREDRWKYIKGDILPNYLSMSPEEIRRQIDTPVEERIQQQRLSERWPTITKHLLGDWDADVGGSVTVGPITIPTPI